MFIVNIYEMKQIMMGVQCDIFGNILGEKRVVLWTHDRASWICRHVAAFSVSIRQVHIPVAMHACSAEYDPKSLYSHVTSLSREYYRFVRKISHSCTMATKVS